MHFLLRIARGSIEHSLTSDDYTGVGLVLQGFFGMKFIEKVVISFCPTILPIFEVTVAFLLFKIFHLDLAII